MYGEGFALRVWWRMLGGMGLWSVCLKRQLGGIVLALKPNSGGARTEGLGDGVKEDRVGGCHGTTGCR